MDELSERLGRLEPFKEKSRAEFDEDPYLRDIVERNLEIAAQCCLDICHRIISLEKARKPADDYDALIRMSELGVLPAEFARHLAPIAGFRNILAHESLSLSWDHVYKNLKNAGDLLQFSEHARNWMAERIAH